MDLDIAEVSELLNVSKPILLEWVAGGKIPSYRIQDQYRFNRQEIENWLLNHKQTGIKKTTPSKQKGQDHFNLMRALNKGEVISDIQGRNKDFIFLEVAQRIAPKLKLDPDILADHLLERERLAPTALGHGYGIPHTKDIFLRSQQNSISVVFLDEPIQYDALDDKPVHTLFFLLSCNDKKHLLLLSKIAHLVQSPMMRQFLATKPSKKNLLPHIKEWETDLSCHADA